MGTCLKTAIRNSDWNAITADGQIRLFSNPGRALTANEVLPFKQTHLSTLNLKQIIFLAT
jgi:hypothetical protein